MPLTREMLDTHIDQFGPYAYHETQNTPKLLEEGLMPRSLGAGGGKGGGWGGRVRENHVYMRIPMGDPKFDEYIRENCSIRIDLRKIDPARFDIDEDSAGVMGANIEDRRRWPKMLEVPYKHPDDPENGFDFDHPEVVEYAMHKYGSVCVRGSIGLESLHVNPDWIGYAPALDNLKSDMEQAAEIEDVLGSHDIDFDNGFTAG